MLAAESLVAVRLPGRVQRSQALERIDEMTTLYRPSSLRTFSAIESRISSCSDSSTDDGTRRSRITLASALAVDNANVADAIARVHLLDDVIDRDRDALTVVSSGRYGVT